MRFGPVKLSEAEGAILAHSVSAGGARIRKGRRLTGDDLRQLAEAGIAEVVAAVLDPGDLDEDAAAGRIARALRTAGVETRPAATGRVNLHAAAAGVFVVEKALIDALNRIDPAVTVATLRDHVRVQAGQMVATVKIIPFAVAASAISQAERICAEAEIFAVRPFQAHRVGVVQTVLSGLKESVLDKTTRVMEARLAHSGSSIPAERRLPHEAEAVMRSIQELLPLSDIVVAFGASAMSDEDDVIPAAIRAAGGTVQRVGMPVDPGNLLVLGEIGGKTVIGAPGCARSPKENGFDWVLDRLLAGIHVSGEDIAAMGVGGLLMEIPSRPQPREAASRPREVQVHAIVLAAGQSSRMGGPNKLLAQFEGEPLVRRTVRRVAESSVAGVTVVVGHQAARIRDALAGTGAAIAENPDFAVGLSSSLKRGIASVPADAAGALIALGDMPELGATDLDQLISAFVQSGGRSIVRATHNGKRGNPVILPRSLFADIAALEGDTGARHIVEAGGGEVIDVEIGAAASVDVDTRQAMLDAGGVLVE